MANKTNNTAKEIRGLCIVRSLLEEFHRLNIRYCHWKSNEHVNAAVKGDTDLDILFDKSQKETILNLLYSSGFSLFIAPWWRHYPDIEDFIGIDPETGKIVHVHAHFSLVLGEKGVKSYRMPWEREVLDTRIFDEEYGIYCSSPTMELFLLIIRMALKVEKGINWVPGNRAEISNYIRESEWLKKRVTMDELSQLFQEKAGKSITGVIENIYRKQFEMAEIIKLQTAIKSKFNGYRRFGSIRAVWEKKIRKVAYYSYKLLRKIRVKDITPKRKIASEGVIISLMGADGAGKSTQTARICTELKKKIDVKFIYMGSGDGSVSLQRRWLKGIVNFGRVFFGNKITRSDGKQNAGNKAPEVETFKRKLTKVLMALSVAREKKVKLKNALNARKRGEIVICDRYPQTTIIGYNDGPRLHQYLDGNHPILRKLAQYEVSLYAISDRIYPDLVIKLLGDPELLYHRRPEMTIDRIIEKQNGIKEIKFSGNTEIIEIDAGMEIDAVTVEAMKSIGRKISNVS